MTVMMVGAVGLIMVTLVVTLLFTVSVYYAWKNFRELFVQEPNAIWYYPNGEPLVPSIATEKKISVTIRLPEHITTDNTTYYSVRVPKELSVALLFYYLVRVQIKYGLIHAADVAADNYGWVFYSLNRSGVRKAALHPDRSIQKNGVRENGVIEAVRLKVSETIGTSHTS